VILEIRTYRLRPGSRRDFVEVMRADALPLLARQGVDVVAAGASLVDEDGYEEAYLIRAFPSLAERDRQEEAFYGSKGWRGGPREAIVSRIESYHTIVVETSAEAVEALRRSSGRTIN
jgi:NIPSNAP